MQQLKKFETEIGGRKLTVELGRLAGQAHGSCTVQYGDTVVLATAVISPDVNDEVDFLPLTVDYEEKLYAAGKIKGSRFIKREGRPSDEAVLTARLVDRSIRPLFDETSRHEIQVVITVLSVDQENDPDIVSLIAASVALSISRIPWQGPVAGVRVGRINGEWVLNPTYEAFEKSDFDLTVVGNQERVVMLEMGGKEVEEKVISEAVQFGHKHVKKITDFIADIQKQVGEEKQVAEANELPAEEKKELEKVEKVVTEKVKEVRDKILATKDKEEQKQATGALKEELDEILKVDNEVSKEGRFKGLKMVDDIIAHEALRRIMEEDIRPDGRKPDEIRPLSCEVGILPRTHGTGLFNRGETQVLSVITLGAPGDEQTLDEMEITGKKRYMHHYNFPGFSVGEVRRITGAGRREIGHGALAEKAIFPLLPNKESFPYTIRVVSEVLSSNGSTSQAAVCGSSLALMDAGVPISAAAAGISIGIVTDDELKNYKILTDIQGVEDHIGGMDFKVAGTRKGITAIQMDVKVAGINYEIVEKALAAAKTAREKILDCMDATIKEPRKELSKYAPRIVSIRINPDKIRALIGPGGKVINKIIEETGVDIDIDDDGLVMVTAEAEDKLDLALKLVNGITHEVAVGEIYTGKVTEIIKNRNTGSEIGAIVEILPGQDGMVHISQLAHRRVNTVSEVVKIGDEVKVKVVEVDTEHGRTSLSIKALQEPPANFISEENDHGRGRGFFRRGARPIPRKRT